MHYIRKLEICVHILNIFPSFSLIVTFAFQFSKQRRLAKFLLAFWVSEDKWPVAYFIERRGSVGSHGSIFVVLAAHCGFNFLKMN